MATIRVSKTSNYSCINNEPLRNSALSWAARGLLAYLLSMPDDWTASTAQLIKQSPAGRDHVLSLLRELETAGYLSRVRKQDSKGQWEWEHLVHETAQNPKENPSTDYPPTDKPFIYQVLNEEVLKKKEGAAPRPPQIELLREITHRYPPKSIWSVLTNRLGPEPDRTKLEQVFQTWIMRGHNPLNYDGITEWYSKGIPPPNGFKQLPTQAEMNAGGRGRLVL